MFSENPLYDKLEVTGKTILVSMRKSKMWQQCSLFEKKL